MYVLRRKVLGEQVGDLFAPGEARWILMDNGDAPDLARLMTRLQREEERRGRASALVQLGDGIHRHRFHFLTP